MTIDSSLRSNISHKDVAKDLWDHLKKRFSVTNGPRIQQIKAELACCKQRGLAIEAYYGKLNRIWDSMANYRPVRVCKCGKCECDLGTLQEQDREEDKVHDFLCGLDDNFRTVRSTLVSRVPLQPLEEIYNIVRQEEDLKTNVRRSEESPEVTAYAAHNRPRVNPARADDGATVCKHCHRPGHLSENCFTVIGYPEWWGDRSKTRTMQPKGRGGQFATASVGRGKNMNFANAVHVSTIPNQERANYVITDKDRDGVNGLSDNQWRTLVNLLNDGATSSNEKLSGNVSHPSWIMDTGASHHLTGKFDILTDVRLMEPVLIVLADGRRRVSDKEGTVVLGNNLILRSVFYVEAFQSDLISITQLMDENQCIVQLADQFLVVQDRGSRMMIGAAKRKFGTFHLCRTEVAASVAVSDPKSYELWHKRMGHPSARVVGSLPHVPISVASENSNKSCDVCLRAKQTRASFPSSSNKTTSVFELVHCDLWAVSDTIHFWCLLFSHCCG